MGMNFPPAPVVGTLYPDPAVPETPQYKWDGTVWRAMEPEGSTGSSVFVSDTPPSPTPPDNSLWWESDVAKLHVRYNDGDNSQWVEAAPQVAVEPDTSGLVKKIGDTMTGHLFLPTSPAAANAVRRDFVEAYAAPLDALSYSGMQINGSMEVSQENGTAPVTVTNGSKFSLDGWRAGSSHPSAVFSVGQVYSGLTPVGPGAYFPQVLMLKATTAMASVATNQSAYLLQAIEGYRVARLGFGTVAARPMTISFWVFATVGGTATLAILNSAQDRSYVASYTLAGGAWEYKTITIPGDTAGSWLIDNRTGMFLYFAFACGPDAQTTPNAWTAGAKLGVAGSSNFFTAVNNQIYLTGVVILPGITAPTASQSPLIMRPYDQELATCKRYWRKERAHGIAHSSVIGDYFGTRIVFAPEMRAQPTCSIVAGGSTTNSTARSINNVLTTGATIFAQSNQSLPVSISEFVDDVTADARL